MNSENLQPEPGGNYWSSVGIAAVIFGFAVFVISLISGYMQINSEPTGSFITGAMFGYLITCLVGAFAGMLAVWHYTREQEPFLKLGRGALIGLLAGGVLVVISGILNYIWRFIDPSYTDRIMQAMIDNVDAMQNIPDDVKQQQIDAIAQQFQNADSFTGTLKQMPYGLPLYGILNLLTGMIGVKLFGRDEAEDQSAVV